MKLNGIHGKARTGKDTAARYLVENHGFLRRAFADPLKLAAQQMFGLSEDETWSEEIKDVVIPYWGRSPRNLFQLLGTEGGRNVFGEDLWTQVWGKFYMEHREHMHIVVPDVRFDNEADLIRSLVGQIIILTSNRATTLSNTAQKHASEAGIKPSSEDIPLDNSKTYQALYARLDQIIDTWDKVHLS